MLKLFKGEQVAQNVAVLMGVEQDWLEAGLPQIDVTLGQFRQLRGQRPAAGTGRYRATEGEPAAVGSQRSASRVSLRHPGCSALRQRFFCQNRARPGGIELVGVETKFPVSALRRLIARQYFQGQFATPRSRATTSISRSRCWLSPRPRNSASTVISWILSSFRQLKVENPRSTWLRPAGRPST